MENPTPSVRETNLELFSSYKNLKLKVQLWRVGIRKRKKRAFFLPFFLPDENFINICVLSRCILY